MGTLMNILKTLQKSYFEMRYRGKNILDNFKYLVTLYTHHFRERFTFSVYFSLESLIFGQFTT